MTMRFPYSFDARGRTAETSSAADAVTGAIEQVLFTSPGERPNLPDFGSGLLQLPFAPNSAEMAAATRFSVQGALQKWLGSAVRVLSVEAAAHEGTLSVTVSYALPNTDVTEVQTFVYGANGGGA